MLLRRSHDISRLEPMEVFNVKVFAGQQMVSAVVGLVVVLIAVLAPRRYAFISPMAFILMWPGHALYESRVNKKRKAFDGQMALQTSP